MSKDRSSAAVSFVGVPPERGEGETNTHEVHLTEELRAHFRAIAHDLRSPLTAISLGIDLVEGDDPSKERIFSVMRTTVRRMDRMIEELLCAPPAGTGDVRVAREAVSARVAILKRGDGSKPR
jgi:K+-sensing histidine kinase KdpD